MAIVISANNAAVRGSRVHRMIRRIAPSVASLTFNPLVKAGLDMPDAVLQGIFPGFRGLPPAHLRARVGVGDEVLRNQLQFHYSSHFWMLAFQEGWARLDSNIVDIGCGCGRYAHHLRDFNLLGRRFTGRYTGIDIDAEALNWCARHYDSRFSWPLSSDKSTTYATSGGKGAYRLPIEDGTQDFIFSTSLFTHLLEPELTNYLSESARVLKSGGIISHSVFCIDHPPPTYGTRHTFSHQMGRARVESEASPEAAVAYAEADLFAMAEAVGFANCRIVTGEGVFQPHLVAERS